MWFDKPCNHKLGGSMTAPVLIHSTEVLLLADSEFLGVTGYRARLALRFNLRFHKFQFFFLLKLSAVCTFWIVLIC